MSIERILRRLDEEYSKAPVIGIPKKFRGFSTCDSHEGVGDLADDFMSADPDFCKVLSDHWLDGFTWISRGDRRDLWENKNPKLITKAHPYAESLYQKYKAADRVIEVPGNHDPDPSQPRMIKLQYPDGKIICVTHGDIGDWVCETQSFWAKLFVRYIWAGIGQRVIGLPDPTSARAESNPTKHLEVREAYNKWAINKGPKFTLLWGHTHHREEVGTEDTGMAQNGGCFIGEHRDVYEIINQKISYVDFT